MRMSSQPAPGRHRHRASHRGGVRAVLRVGSRVTAAAISITLLLGSGWGWYNFADLKRHTHVIDISGLGGPTATTGRPAPKGDGTAQNILIVGIDTRANLSPAQRRYLKVGNDTSTSTDTLMLVHVPADGSKATLISIPRDSWVQIPGHPDGKINAAYADGYGYSGAHGADPQQKAGADALVATVKQLTGVPIDHYVQVDFKGFVNIVGAIGRIPINLCQSVDDTHANNVANGIDGGSGFKMSAGHHDLTPRQALEFVRQRHNIPGPVTDDLGRELRQRYFLSAAFKKVLSARTLLDPFRLRNLIKAVDSAFTFDSRNFDITKFAEQMINLSAGNIVGRSIPTDGDIYMDGQDALRVDPAKVRAVVRRAFYPSPKAPATGSPTHRTGAPATRAGTASDGLSSPAKRGCVY